MSRVYTRIPIADRFWTKVDRHGPDGCWVWVASKCQGYGQIGDRAAGRPVRAHRVAYELLVGPIPEGLFIDHLCRNRACVNPDHLRAVTPRTNALENSTSFAALNALKTCCANGHPLSGANVYRWKNRRYCATCRKIIDDRRHARERAERRS